MPSSGAPNRPQTGVTLRVRRQPDRTRVTRLWAEAVQNSYPQDDCFIGARSEVVEGVVVERGSVLGMGVYIGQSTRIYDRETGEIHYGRVPAGSVVVAGNLPSKDGKYSLYCAVIVKKVDEKTRGKTSLNELLRTVD